VESLVEADSCEGRIYLSSHVNFKEVIIILNRFVTARFSWR
jgi:hypothetical protein